MRRCVYLLVILIEVAVCRGPKVSNNLQKNIAQHSSAGNNREKKLFSMFSLVTFPNEECTSSDSECGTCMTASECSGLKGLVSGSCAQGFGACCVVYHDTCGGTVSNNRTYIRNPGYSSSYTTAGTCTWTLAKCANNICMIRLDFEESSIAQPSTIGICATDHFKGTPAKTGKATPLICGENAGQHIYLDGGSYNTASATLVLTLTGATARKWKMKVSMVECDSLQKPPQGCLQYHTGNTGSVRSFNYQDSTAYNHLQSHSYNVCIRQEKGYCRIGWKQDDGTKDSFKMGRGTGAYNSLNSGGCEATGQADYVVIPNGSDGGLTDAYCEAAGNTMVPSVDKFCGGTLTCITGSSTPAEVISNVRPFTLGVFLNDMEGTGINNRGFKLNYRQIAC